MQAGEDGTTAGFSTPGAPVAVGEAPRPAPSLRTLTILAHPDPRRVGARLFLSELAHGRETAVSRRGPEFEGLAGQPCVPLADRFLSRRPLILRGAAEDGVELLLGDSRTHVRANGEPVDQRRVFPAAAVADGVVLELAGRIVLLLHERRPPPLEQPRYGLIGESEALATLRQAVAAAAGTDVPVLLLGETGTGKELVARALHEHGRRATRPYVALSLAALAPSLAVSELFGARKGAFTGALRDQPGYFGLADGGTLFLDEVGEAPPEIQALLLRAIESGEIFPVGTQTPRRVDVRLLAATDADLDAAVAQKLFRAPLLHRLASLQIRLPPLRARRDDVGLLLLHFVCQERRRMGLADVPGDDAPWPPAWAVARLARYGWPGNVRQLRNVARQLVVAGRVDDDRRLEGLLDELLGPAPGSAHGERRASAKPAVAAAPSVSYRQPYLIEEDELLAALEANRWRLQPTAAQLGVSRTSLYALIDRCERIRRATDIEVEELTACHRRNGGDLEAMARELRVSRHGLQRRLRELAVGSGD